MVLLLEAKDANEWGYKGEGAANVVMAYHGISSLFVGKILRVQKALVSSLCDNSSINAAPVLSIEEQSLWSDWQEVVEANSKEILTQAYAKCVMSRLLGSEHVDPGMLIRVSKGFLEALEESICNQRPAWRIEAAKIDLQSDFALLISDHSLFLQGPYNFSPCISIEIKPKCGFLPCSRFISAGNHMKKCVSRFAMHQCLKLAQGRISCISKYSPLYLFSESRDRIHAAINGLFETPQNNLRIFLNGSLILGGLGDYAEHEVSNGSITDSIDKNLEDAFEILMPCQKGDQVACIQELVIETLFKTRILSQLLAVQKMDLYDIEGAIHAYYNIIGKPCDVCTRSSEARNTQNAGKIMSDESMNAHTREDYSYLHSLSMEESRNIVRDYLIAATAKDCSLMLTFQPLPDDFTTGNSHDGSNVVYLPSTKQVFRYKACYIDLDLKPLKRMVHYYKLDQNIVSYYIKYMKEI